VSAILERISHSVRETEAIAAELARTLSGGEVIALYGELGAGKTQFTRGLVIGLGGDGRDVSSPTFVLLNVYETPRLKVFHLDAYRVTGADDFDAIGFSELLEQGGVVVVEWPTRVEDLLPPRDASSKRINVHLETVSAHGRRIRIEPLLA
jgi:tRNA threonylcarbamoyladenosine biosynthesis protein TsaE